MSAVSGEAVKSPLAHANVWTPTTPAQTRSSAKPAIVAARISMQLFCVFLLLFAEQMALTHATWHAAGYLEPHASANDKGGEHQGDAQQHLCIFDAALSQVLGAACGAAPAWLLHSTAAVMAVAATHSAVVADHIRAVSRGPPFLL